MLRTLSQLQNELSTTFVALTWTAQWIFCRIKCHLEVKFMPLLSLTGRNSKICCALLWTNIRSRCTPSGIVLPQKSWEEIGKWRKQVPLAAPGGRHFGRSRVFCISAFRKLSQLWNEPSTRFLALTQTIHWIFLLRAPIFLSSIFFFFRPNDQKWVLSAKNSLYRLCKS